MKANRASLGGRAAAGFLALALAGCGIEKVGDVFSGGASMRVDVEVYKGPLSKEVDVQWSELTTIIYEASNGLASFNDNLLHLAVASGYVAAKPQAEPAASGSPPEAEKRAVQRGSLESASTPLPSPRPVPNQPPAAANPSKKAELEISPHHRGNYLDTVRGITPPQETETRVVAKIQGSLLPWENVAAEEVSWCGDSGAAGTLTVDGMSECILLAQLHDDVRHLIRLNGRFYESVRTDGTGQLSSDKFVKAIGTVAEIGARFKAKAFYWAQAEMAAPSSRREMRYAAVSFANMAAEYGNQIGSRADVLLKQCRTGGKIPLRQNDCRGTYRELLPLSVYLREINPTEFLNLFVYNRATKNGMPIAAETLTRPFWELGSEETRDRVRVMEHLFADHNWSRINTVHANGRGDVRMAFIKDDIGNWNLKSFSNDPGELLKAYGELGRATVVAATKLAADVGSAGGASAMNRALDFAGRTARGRVGPGAAEAGGVNIEALRRTVDGQIQRTAALRQKDEKTIPAKPASGNPETPSERSAREAWEKTVANEKDKRLATYRELRAILKQYDGMLEALQASVAAGATSDQSGAMGQFNALNK